jgi:hypothetical protein
MDGLDHSKISMARQCDLLSLTVSTTAPRAVRRISVDRLLDEQYAAPFTAFGLMVCLGRRSRSQSKQSSPDAVDGVGSDLSKPG